MHWGAQLPLMAHKMTCLFSHKTLLPGRATHTLKQWAFLCLPDPHRSHSLIQSHPLALLQFLHCSGLFPGHNIQTPKSKFWFIKEKGWGVLWHV